MKFTFIKTISNIAPIAIGSMNIHTLNLEFSNGYIEQKLGYTFNELVDLAKTHFHDIIHPDDRDIVENNIARVKKAKGGEVFDSHVRLRKKMGGYVYWYIRDSVYSWTKNGEPERVASTLEDRTHVLELENKLKEKVNKLKEISYKNSHELRAPVANIIAIVDNLKDDDFKCHKTQRMFKFLKETVLKLDKVIMDINDSANEGY